jgi:hypothetical protein
MGTGVAKLAAQVRPRASAARPFTGLKVDFEKNWRIFIFNCHISIETAEMGFER